MDRSLTPTERAIIDFERAWWLQAGTKAAAIRVQLGMAPASYYRTLRALLQEPAALAYDPLTVRRLRRQHEERRRQRLEGRRADPTTR